MPSKGKVIFCLSVGLIVTGLLNHYLYSEVDNAKTKTTFVCLESKDYVKQGRFGGDATIVEKCLKSKTTEYLERTGLDGTVTTIKITTTRNHVFFSF